jgi:hypothetical protein
MVVSNILRLEFKLVSCITTVEFRLTICEVYLPSFWTIAPVIGIGLFDRIAGEQDG